MQSIPTPSANDPVSQAVLRSAQYSGRFPVPLIASSYDIKISGGLADVSAKRTFRNEEISSIEAVLTFPLPVHAVLYSLEARIGDRVVKAVAKAKSAAREAYEDAVDSGKTAVLHEELLKGVHMLSVGHVAPGTEIEVTARFALPLAWIGGRALLRIPTTVGDVYGSSGLPDSDELVHGGTVLAANITVASDTGTPRLSNGTLDKGAARVWLDAPISIEVRDWQPRDLLGAAADGRAVSLAIKPAGDPQVNIDATILIDHSGSMNEACAASSRLSKHTAVLIGLNETAASFTVADRINLWEFDDVAVELGDAPSKDFKSLVQSLSPPSGGTKIGMALDAVLAKRRPHDILLITDGKSHALDVQKLAASGARFTVVLIGDDSLEANVGHLAALSGGEIFVAAGADAADGVRAAIASLRRPRLSDDPNASSDLSSVRVARSGMEVSATWSREPIGAPSREASRAAAAYSASLRLARLPANEAAALAEREGLVTHLTSLILVDEEGAVQSGLPALRKVALPSPATYAAPRAAMLSDALVNCLRDAEPPMRSASTEAPSGPSRLFSFSPGRGKSAVVEKRRSGPASGGIARSDAGSSNFLHEALEEETALARLIGKIDWRNDGGRLADAIMRRLPPDIAGVIDEVADLALVVRAAQRLGLSPRALVLGLLARADGAHDRYAERVARALLGKTKPRHLARVASHVGLAVAAA